MRPLLCCLLCKELAAACELAVQAAPSLELMHASSLVHDDLPGLDNDSMRRGKPTVHVAFGEATAVLAGDVLIPLCYRNIIDTSLDPSVKVALMNSLTRAFIELCDGQQRDLKNEQDPEQLMLVHSLKTGALFRASAEFAGILSERSIDQQQLLGRLGCKFGICFQIKNDYQDVFASGTERGRVESSDLRNEKRTFFAGQNVEQGKAAFQSELRELEEIFSEVEKATGKPLPESREFCQAVLKLG